MQVAMDAMEGVAATLPLYIDGVYAHSSMPYGDAMDVDSPLAPLYMCNNVDVLAALPVEMFEAMFAALTPSDLLLGVARVCRAFRALSLSQSLWRELCARRWPLGADAVLHAGVHTSWMTYYREKAALEQPFKWEALQHFSYFPRVDANLRLEDDGSVDETTPFTYRMRQGQCACGDKVVLVGGHLRTRRGDFNRKNDIWIVDGHTNKFSQLDPIGGSPPLISRHSLACVNGTVYSLCGILQDKTKINDVFALNPDTREWRRLTCSGTPPEPRNDCVCVAYGDQIVLFGGSIEGLVFPTDVHVFDTRTHCWWQPQINGGSPDVRISCAGEIVGDVMYVYGGGYWDQRRGEYTDKFHDLWALNLTTWTWHKPPMNGTLPTALSVFCATARVGHHLIVDGGRDFLNGKEAAYIYDTVSGYWSRMHYEGERYPNSNSMSASLVGNKIIYVGFYRPYALDISPLSFLNDLRRPE